jgi:simple sugar transport system ATP-binding protein
VAELSDKLGFGIDPRALIADCSVATQQRVEILKVLYRGAEVLILDEPTAALAPAEAEALLGTIRTLRDDKKSVLFVSHKLREVLAVASRVAVMRRGKIVAELEASATSPREIAELMVGAGASASVRAGAAAMGVSPSERAPAADEARGSAERGERVALLRGVHARNERGLPALRGIDMELFAGEIAAVAGVDGNGQTELAEVLTGLRAIDEGTLELARGADSRGAVAHIPEDRQKRGLCLSLTVEENLALGRHRSPDLVLHGVIDRVDARARERLADELIEALDVRPRDRQIQAVSLSGGNQQKVIVAREILGAPPKLPRAPAISLVVAVQPTRGLDLGAMANVHARLREARDAGAAVLLVSMDLDEVRALGDRILVMAGGRVVAELPPGADEATIGRHMLAGGEAARG